MKHKFKATKRNIEMLNRLKNYCSTGSNMHFDNETDRIIDSIHTYDFDVSFIPPEDRGFVIKLAATLEHSRFNKISIISPSKRANDLFKLTSYKKVGSFSKDDSKEYIVCRRYPESCELLISWYDYNLDNITAFQCERIINIIPEQSSFAKTKTLFNDFFQNMGISEHSLTDSLKYDFLEIAGINVRSGYLFNDRIEYSTTHAYSTILLSQSLSLRSQIVQGLNASSNTLRLVIEDIIRFIKSKNIAIVYFSPQLKDLNKGNTLRYFQEVSDITDIESYDLVLIPTLILNRNERKILENAKQVKCFSIFTQEKLFI